MTQDTGKSSEQERGLEINYKIGDRVTLLDKFMVRAADVGTIEAITDKGIQILWDNKIPDESSMMQPPRLWRTFWANELEFKD
jgi:hypothetical protein